MFASYIEKRNCERYNVNWLVNDHENNRIGKIENISQAGAKIYFRELIDCTVLQNIKIKPFGIKDEYHVPVDIEMRWTAKSEKSDYPICAGVKFRQLDFELQKTIKKLILKGH